MTPRRDAEAVQWGRSIRWMRENKLYITQGELAERIEALATAAGVTNVTVGQEIVSRWENGQRKPSLRVRPWIAKALETDAITLFVRLPEEAVA